MTLNIIVIFVMRLSGRSDGGHVVGCDGCLTWIHQTFLRIDDYAFGLLLKTENFHCDVCLALRGQGGGTLGSDYGK